MSDLVGTRWHDLGGAGAPAGGVVIVERVEDYVAYGRRDTGEPWAEGLSFLTGGKFYAAIRDTQAKED